MEAVERHRANEGGFRFETSAQLKEVEDERIRLEKERRVSPIGGRVRVNCVEEVACSCFRGNTDPCWLNLK